MAERKKFRKAYTRDFSIIMEEAWYAGLAHGLWDKLHVKSPEGFPNFFRFNQGIIEVWEDEDFVKKIMQTIWDKREDSVLFDNLLEDYKKMTTELQNEKLDDSVYFAALFEAISIFPIIWYGILDSRTEENLRNKFVYVRDRDTIFDSNDKIVRKRILKKHPDFKGIATTLLKEEFLHNPPSISVLKERLNNFILVPGEYAEIIDLGKFATRFNISLELTALPKDSVLKGVSANPGKASGSVRIIRMKDDVKNMKKGEILVSPMTTPDVFSALRLAAAIVTDEGGMLSHAAILSREFNIPCVIGTKVASEIYKDGDMIEVDADKGVVRKI